MTTQRQNSYRDVVREIEADMVPPGMPGTFIWGTVQSNDGGSPPTCTVTLGASPTPVSDIAYNANYSPNPGDKVLILEMESDRFVICAQAS